MYNGIINVYKEAGFTSHDVVAKLRGILKQKKIGHTGTLDPDAIGVLPVCLGSGTKLCDMLTDKSKEYRAVMLLGKTTDTEDISGKILTEKNVDIEEKELRDIIESFIGKYEQIPPMYSALKVNGQKLCDLARKGVEIERKPRPVEINEITIEKIDFPEVTMLIKCSKGTYIRSLCRDIGEKAGCGACMKSLVRTRVGIFKLEEAHTLQKISEITDDMSVESIITPVDNLFSEYEKIIVDGRNEMLVKNGNMFRTDIYSGADVRVYLSDGTFAGIYTFDTDNSFYKPKKMFLGG